MLPDIEFDCFPVLPNVAAAGWGGILDNVNSNAAAHNALRFAWEALPTKMLRDFGSQLLTNWRVVGVSRKHTGKIVLAGSVDLIHNEEGAGRLSRCIIVPPPQVNPLPDMFKHLEFESFLLVFGGLCDVSQSGIGRFATMPMVVDIADSSASDGKTVWSGSRILYEIPNGDALIYSSNGVVGLYSHENGLVGDFSRNLGEGLTQWMNTVSRP